MTSPDKTKNLETLLSIYNQMVGLNLFTDKKVFELVQDQIRELFEIPNLTIAISTFFQKGDKKSELIRLMMLDHQYKSSDIKRIYRDAIHYSNKHYEQSVYFTNVHEKYVVIEDFTKLKKSGIDYWLMRRGVRGMILVPLRNNEKDLLGFLELTSTDTLSLGPSSLEHVENLVPVFTNSVAIFIQALRAELHGLIQKHFTAIHPTVEWLFEDLAIEWLKGEDDTSIESPIFLEKIYCLYGNSDIRGSSELRRSAIQKDLRRQVDLAQLIMNCCADLKPLDHFRHLSFRLEKYKEALSDTMKVNDENSVLLFLKNEVESLFDTVKKFSPEIAKLCVLYLENLSEASEFYQHRRKFETSVHNLNVALNNFIDEEQNTLQKIYPHFFEKHITDGIEHSIYIGTAIDFTKNFSLLHLKSLKLWQLKLLCKSALLGEKIKKDLGLPLELAHLIVSQIEPVTIYFDLQEKKFKVEGTYNIRFEILKKRIDKACIKNTQERLTQPGTVAVVYSLDNDKEEYLQYFDYLQNLGYIKPHYGDYVLEDMQGIQGLRALRVEVDFERLAGHLDLDSLLGKDYVAKK